jgi:hypothetical protein
MRPACCKDIKEKCPVGSTFHRASLGVEIDPSVRHEDDTVAFAEIFDDDASCALPLDIYRRMRNPEFVVEIEVFSSQNVIPFFWIQSVEAMSQYKERNIEVLEHALGERMLVLCILRESTRSESGHGNRVIGLFRGKVLRETFLKAVENSFVSGRHEKSERVIFLRTDLLPVSVHFSLRRLNSKLREIVLFLNEFYVSRILVTLKCLLELCDIEFFHFEERLRDAIERGFVFRLHHLAHSARDDLP